MSQNQRGLQNTLTERENCIVCNKCPSALQASVHVSLDKSITEILKSTRTSRRDFFKDLIKKVNALMNVGGGIVYINCEESLRHFLDEQIEDELMKLVPDNSLFSDNFERRDLCDNHVAIRVKPRDHGILSTFDFHTKVSLNKGLVDPNHFQIIRHIKKCLNSCTVNGDENDNNNKRNINTFHQGECVAFNENKDTQAKAVCLEDLQMVQGASNGEKLLSYMFDNLRLPHYISAFTKQENGGSLFIGLKEDKRDDQKDWVQVKHMDDLKVVFGTDKTFWKDDKSKGKKQLFHVAAYQDVPGRVCRTGKFICDGIWLSAQDKDYLKRELMNKMKRTMVWDELPQNHNPDVSLKFHPVQSDSVNPDVSLKFHPVQSDSVKNETKVRTVNGDVMELCVIEVMVKFFSGLCFYDQRPEAYTVTNRENPNSIERLSESAWFKSYVRLNRN